MRKSEAVVGTRVRKVMGVALSGVIVKPFHWKQSTDGTYRAPDDHEHVPVEWDDGTKGYVSRYHITYE